MPHVLVVEDHHDYRELLRAVLTLHGYSSDGASNKPEALDRMRERRPCVVLLDLTKGAAGWQLREQQLLDPAIADIPVLCLTERQRWTADELCARYMEKPVELSAVAEAVREICGPGIGGR